MNNLKELKEHFNGCVGYDNQGHWLSKEPMSSEGNFGFIYCLEMKETGNLYVGSKQFWSERKLMRSGKKKKVIQEAKWKNYGSSSKLVERMIRETVSDDSVNYYHLHSWKTKRTLVNAEQMTMHNMGFLTRANELNPEFRMFLNQWANKVFACSKPEDLEELRQVFIT